MRGCVAVWDGLMKVRGLGALEPVGVHCTTLSFFVCSMRDAWLVGKVNPTPTVDQGRTAGLGT